MIERISELPFFGPEEQIRRFITQVVDSDTISKLDAEAKVNDPNSEVTQKTITQDRIGNIDELLQRQLIWSYDKSGVDDAYFYWDWCPYGYVDPTTQTWVLDRWDIDSWFESQENLTRLKNRSLKYSDLRGYTNQQPLSSGKVDELPISYSSAKDVSAQESTSSEYTLESEVLMHNMMRAYIEVSEWLGDAATAYGSHNGFVSRKMSMCWLFDAIRALINFKMKNQDKFAEKDIHPLDISEEHHERFLSKGEKSDCGIYCGDAEGNYTDELDLEQQDGRCSIQKRVRSSKPDVNGVLKVRGNAWFYGERADFYTHNSFMGECRFFHNTRFLGQATFDKEINGTALRSRWADLSEMYESDSNYEPGTLVMFGGEKEITKSNGKVCNAVITTKPGLILNGDDKPGKTMLGIALAGRVPVKVIGEVKKFDKLVSDKSNPGFARSRKWYDFFQPILGIALDEAKDGIVECSVKLNF